jgi:hypothetical protein
MEKGSWNGKGRFVKRRNGKRKEDRDFLILDEKSVSYICRQLVFETPTRVGGSKVEEGGRSRAMCASTTP